MRMSIAEPIQTLEYLRDSGAFPFSTKEGVLYTAESIDEVIETMLKYQKIIPALVNYDLLNPIADVKTIDGEGIYINLSDLQDYIQKVVEDENVD